MLRILLLLAIMAVPATSQALARERPLTDASASVTQADFSINAEKKPMVSVVATIENHPADAQHYRLVTLNFYSFSLTDNNFEDVKGGSLKSVEDRRYEGDSSHYNNSNAKIILTIDNQGGAITQVDMAVPGYTCTIAWKPDELRAFSENYIFLHGRIRIKNSGAYNCGSSPQFVAGWNFDVSTPVFQLK